MWEKKENYFSFRLFYFNLLLCTFERLPNAVAYKPRVVQLLICQTFKHLDFVVWVIFQISLKYFSPVLWDISFDLCKIFPSRAGCWKWGSLNWRLGWSLARLSTKLQTFSCSLAYFTKRNYKYNKKNSCNTDRSEYTAGKWRIRIHIYMYLVWYEPILQFAFIFHSKIIVRLKSGEH